jgi:hypothetical protein
MCTHHGRFWAENDKQGALLSVMKLRSTKAVASRALRNACVLCCSWKRHVPIIAQSSSTDSCDISFSSVGRIMVMTAPP